MTPLEVVRDACGRRYVSEDGDPVSIELAPGLSAAEIANFEAALPCPLPTDVRELLAHCRGFSGTVEIVDFAGRDVDFEQAELLPHGLPIAADGFGNFWEVDLWPDSRAFAPIYFVCHDVPVFLLQSRSLAEFLSGLFLLNVPPFHGPVDDVREDRLFDVWRKNPGVREREECLRAEDAELAAFARELDDTWQIIDMRAAEIGFGFSWGRYGPRTAVRRHGAQAIFAYHKRPGLLERLFGRSRRP